MERRDLDKSNLPDVPGVYLFKRGREVLYVGKATSLRDRVRSYFDDDLISTRGPRIVDMVTRADRLSYEATPTVLEALVREAALIKKYQPRANVDGKDDKTFLYAAITKEQIPRVLVVRGKDLHTVPARSVFGPFPSGTQLREALRLIRRIFPFFDSPKPVGEGGRHQRAHEEFNRQIQQSPQRLDVREYRRTIHKVSLLLAGRGKELRRALERQMRDAARKERFEDAAEARRELFALDHIQDVSLLKSETRDRQPDTGFRLPASGFRIEAYDTAHIAGTNAVGVMTVIIDGVPTKSEYRTFRIRGFKKNDDIVSLREILSRRLSHPEWPYPKAIVVDGGRLQKKAAETVLAEAGVAIPVVAVVKDERHRPREVIGLTSKVARVTSISEADAVLANAEAHRFSLAHHRRARSRSL